MLTLFVDTRMSAAFSGFWFVKQEELRDALKQARVVTREPRRDRVRSLFRKEPPPSRSRERHLNPRHCWRSATIGSTDAARRAGTRHATSAAASRVAATTAK